MNNKPNKEAFEELGWEGVSLLAFEDRPMPFLESHIREIGSRITHSDYNSK